MAPLVLFENGAMNAKWGLAPLLEETTFPEGGLFIVVNNEFINKAPALALAKRGECASSVSVFEHARLRSSGKTRYL
jgi:hypothetical protein